MEQERAATLHRIVASIQRRWGERALRFFRQHTDQPFPVMSTTFESLDALLAIGGLPRGRITEFLGTPTSGMTTIALTLLAHAQAKGDVAAYIDLSRTFDAEYASALGVDLSALLLVRPLTADETLELLQALIGSGGIGVLVIDALALFQTNFHDDLLLERTLRVLPSVLAASPCVLIVLTPLPYTPEFIRALAFQGSRLAHAATIRLHFARENWLAVEHGSPGCGARVSVLKHKLAQAYGDTQVVIRFPDGVFQ